VTILMGAVATNGAIVSVKVPAAWVGVKIVTATTPLPTSDAACHSAQAIALATVWPGVQKNANEAAGSPPYGDDGPPSCYSPGTRGCGTTGVPPMNGRAI